jgi:enoyl-CoA hydratase/carnithine racemase
MDKLMGSKSSVLNIRQHEDMLTLTLNRAENANALSPELVEAMIDALGPAQEIRLCILRAEGKNFCAGFDLSDIEDLSDGDLLWRFLRIEHLLQMVHHSPFPFLALAQGQVVGAGADLFAACWRRVAAENARFRMPGWNFELALGTRRLTRLVGQTAARDLLIDARTVTVKEALGIGLATDIADPENWTAIVDSSLQRAQMLPQNALRHMLDLTRVDTRAQDIAAIVHSAGRPGLKDRIIAYRNRVIAERKVRKIFS